MCADRTSHRKGCPSARHCRVARSLLLAAWLSCTGLTPVSDAGAAAPADKREPAPAIWANYAYLAMKALARGDYEHGERFLDRALEEAEALGAGNARVATTLNLVADLYEAQGRYDDAEAALHRALAIDGSLAGQSRLHIVRDLHGLADLYHRWGRFVAAEEQIRRALAIVVAELGPTHPHVAMCLNDMAVLHSARGLNAEAERHYRDALAIFEARLGPNSMQVAMTLENFAALLRVMHRDGEAADMEARAHEIRYGAFTKVEQGHN